MEKMEVTLNKTTLKLNESTGSLSVLDSDVGLLFSQYPLRDGYSISNAEVLGNEMSFTVTRAVPALVFLLYVRV